MSEATLTIEPTTASSGETLRADWSKRNQRIFGDSGHATVRLPLGEYVQWKEGFDFEALNMVSASQDDGALANGEGRTHVSIYLNDNNRGIVTAGSSDTVEGLVFELKTTK